MFKTSIWVTDDSSSTVYMRPETAQWIFVDFANVLRTSRRKIPFWVAQVGKAFRNEITPGNFIFRTREFEQMEIEYFCEPGKDLEVHAAWKEACRNFLVSTLSIKEENIRLRDHDQDELSHYSNATTDIEYKFPFGWWELWVSNVMLVCPFTSKPTRVWFVEVSDKSGSKKFRFSKAALKAKWGESKDYIIK